ncbi:MAG TPA: radical SAM family heme chaperone HemW [Gammaproteobacteria bacterium]|jgi:oxygen-independent coproporphyrinogen-3 oxidase|nr:radical SAM family heme chaperone HemW [Gammaproteobacteria bacterium]
MPMITLPPLSLYVHLPWCVKKCPYCDFNSHASKGDLPQAIYVDKLLQELDVHLPWIADRQLISIFFGGGTPSLFSGEMIARILNGVTQRIPLSPDIEITLEANPGTTEYERFRDFRAAGINRLSLGIQSLQNSKLQTLGRIHDRDQALRAITFAQEAGLTNLNVDLMYGLPQQSIDDALEDLSTVLDLQPTHLSWYQLTIEPNTLFHHQPPPLPAEDLIWDMQQAGQHLLQTAALPQYEVSAYATHQRECLHNLNYWQFGDYLGIGAGAHSKITTTNGVQRFAQVKHPQAYLSLDKEKLRPSARLLTEADLIFEFMLNALRLTKGISTTIFMQRTGLARDCIQPMLAIAKKKGLLQEQEDVDAEEHFCASALGQRFLNDLQSIFMG